MYCTYLTIYSGDKLPPFYIGSTSLQKYEEGYCGSVSSKKYKDIWRQELKNNPHLFDTVILSEHNTREEALIEENILQRKLNVVKNSNFINQSFANINGFFGMETKGENHPMYGKNHSEEHKSKISDTLKGNIPWNKGKTHSEETKKKISNKTSEAMKGKPHPTKIITCPHCGKEGCATNIKRYHFDNCKYITNE